jgi:hypothetical protein
MAICKKLRTEEGGMRGMRGDSRPPKGLRVWCQFE